MTACVDPHYPTRPDDDAVQKLSAAIRALPVEHHEEVEEQLALAAVDYERTRNPARIVHFVESLLMTARLHRDPEYVKAVELAQYEDPTRALDAREVIANARARRAARHP